MLRDGLTYLGYAAGWAAVRRMPEEAAQAAFERLADRQWRRRSAGVRRLEANLARVLAPGATDPSGPTGPADPAVVREASRAGMRSYMRYWCDTFRLPGWPPERIAAFELRDHELVAADLAGGRGVILAVPHMGNWDHAGAFVSTHVAPLTTVAEQLRPQRLFDAFVELRAASGMRILGLGEPGVYEALRATLLDGGLVALVSDRDLSASGVGVRFFGEQARFPAGAAALAIDTAAVLRPVSLFLEGTRNAGQVHDPIVPPEDGQRTERIAATTQALADVFTREIGAHPTDWHMLQRVWLADLDPARLAASDAAALGAPGRGTGD